MQAYLQNLYNQFKEAKGIKTSDEKLNSIDAEFNNWLIENNIVAQKYIEFLDNFKLNFKSDKCVEIGKGYYDTVVLPYKTNIITPALFTFRNKDSRRIKGGVLTICNNAPAILNGTKIDTISCLNYETYMTQNTFNDSEIDILDDIQNSGYGNAIIGMYGLKYDKDKEEKIQKLVNLEKSNRGYKLFYYDLKDNYFAVAVGSRKKVLRKRLDVPTIINGKFM